VSIALAHRGGAAGGGLRPDAQRPVLRLARARRLPQRQAAARVQAHALSDALIGTGFPFRKGDNFKRYVKMFEEVMQSCAGLRRPGAAALDLCYVAAGWYDGFFETGLNPWDVAAGSLIITEAGGLIGNFTGEADFLYQREVVAGTPKVYGQLVQILAPYTRVIKEAEAQEPAPASAPDPMQALAGAPAEPAKKDPVRIRKAQTPPADDAPM
jgi:myo-inositol-1(or 4)-monophosphatase